MIALDSRSKAKLTWLAVLFAPAMAVQIVRVGVGSDLSAASANVTQPVAVDPTQMIAMAERPLSEKQKEAMRWLRAEAPKAPTRSPLQPAARVQPSPPPPAPMPEQPRPPGDTRLPESSPPPTNESDWPSLTLTGMVGTAHTGLVVINHKLRRVGDVVAPGWTLRHIDSRRRTAYIVHPDGRILKLSPPSPE